MFEYIDTDLNLAVATDDFYEYLVDLGYKDTIDINELFEVLCDYLEDECV